MEIIEEKRTREWKKSGGKVSAIEVTSDNAEKRLQKDRWREEEDLDRESEREYLPNGDGPSSVREPLARCDEGG